MIKKVIVVVFIAGLLLLMLVPSYLSVQFGENENIIKGRLRALYEANELYRKIHRPPEYTPSISELIKSNPPLVDEELIEPAQAGYQFIYERPEGDKYSITAKPIIKFLTGYHTYFVNETGIIRLNSAAGDPIDT
jgi:type II secretory pathway pseudopilin PulG